MGRLRTAIIAAIIAYITYRCLKTDSPENLRGLLEGKNVAITGASSGIGEQVALLFCKYGANVIIFARREDRLREVVKQCSKSSPLPTGKAKLDYIVADFNDVKNSGVVMKKAIDKFGGRLDYLYLNHAYLLSTPEVVDKWEGTEKQLETMDKSINTNFLSFVRMAGVTLPYLKANNGSITAISSFMAEIPAFTLPYGTTKAAVNAFFTGLRQELIHSGANVSVTLVHLGLVQVGHTKDSLRSMSLAQGRDMEAIVSVLPQTSAHTAALDLVHAVVMRESDVYYPGNQRLWWFRLLRLLLPRPDENVKKLEEFTGAILGLQKTILGYLGL